MWTRSAANKQTGIMTVVCTDWNGEEFYRGEFDNLAQAEMAGQDAERRMTSAMTAPGHVDCDMTDEELLAELTA